MLEDVDALRSVAAAKHVVVIEVVVELVQLKSIFVA